MRDPLNKRGSLQIIADILYNIGRGVLKTHIMYKANLNSTQLKKYLRLMINLDLLKTTKIEKRKIYKSTEKGKRFLKFYQQLDTILQ